MKKQKQRQTLNLWKDNIEFINTYCEKNNHLTPSSLVRAIVEDWTDYMKKHEQENRPYAKR